MRILKTILMTGAITLGMFGVVTMQSCSKKDKCKVVCNNGGTCVDGQCECLPGFEGKDCSIESRMKFKGMFNVIDHCVETDRNEASRNYTIFIMDQPKEDVQKVTVKGLGNIDSSVELEGVVQDQKIIINKQVKGGKEYYGEIEYLDQSSLKGSFTIKDGNETIESCFSAMARQ